MPYAFYKVLHLTGIFMILLSLGAIALHTINGGTKNYAARKWVSILHGVGLLVVFVAGFGLMARLGLITGWPTWIYIKLSIWAVLGAMPVLLYRVPKYSIYWGSLTFLLASFAAWTAIYKPFTSL